MFETPRNRSTVRSVGGEAGALGAIVGHSPHDYTAPFLGNPWAKLTS